MFGYIRPLKPQMRICEYDTYKAIYCGLCKQLGRSYGLFARFTLSYDFAFLSTLSSAIAEETPQFCAERCMAHPLQKKSCCVLDKSSRFSACAAMVMLYYKVEDNYRDSRLGKGKWLALLAMPFANRARKKAMLEYPKLDEAIAAMMQRQYALEEARCSSVDEAAEPTAQGLSQVFAMLGGGEAERRVLARLGYLLGRWIYLMDALDDLDDDLQNGGYNVFALADHCMPRDDLTATRDTARAVLNQTAAEAAKAYELLTLKRYQPILDNVIYLGLKNSLNLVWEKRSNAHDRSL